MNDSETKRIVLFTKQTILAHGLRTVLSDAVGLHLAGGTSDSVQLSAIVSSQQPDLLLLDISSGTTITAICKLQSLSAGTKIVLCGEPETTEFVWQAIDHGIRGIIPSTTPPTEFQAILRAIGNGDVWFERQLALDLLLTKRPHLTVRERQLISLMVRGLSNKELAHALQVGVGTVKVYLSRVFKKVGVRDRYELALYALKNISTGLSVPHQADSTERSADPVLRLKSEFPKPTDTVPAQKAARYYEPKLTHPTSWPNQRQ